MAKQVDKYFDFLLSTGVEPFDNAERNRLRPFIGALLSIEPWSGVEITKERLASWDDDEVCDRIWDVYCEISMHIPTADHPTLIRILPRGLQTILCLTKLNGEIYNGGFAQFFINTNNGALNAMVENSLQRIGEKKVLVLFQQAVVLLEQDKVRKDEKPTQEINELATKYYASQSTPDDAPPLFELMVKFIRSNDDICILVHP